MSLEIQNYFNENGYVVIKNHLPETIANIAYSYTLKKVNRLKHRMETIDNISYNSKWDGFIGDSASGETSFNFYGDELMDTILEATLPFMQDYTGLNLLPTYAFLRMYQFGDDLPYHSDRDSCEISTTLFLGHNIENVDKKLYPDYYWPIFVKNHKGEFPICLKPGDMLIYKGIELPHWREKFIGNNQAQVFLHYNNIDKPNANLYDGRIGLGLPKHIKKI